MKTNTITTGDYLDIGENIIPGSVDLIMTSPPYPGQKNDSRGVSEWLNWFTAVSRLMYANLTANGVLALNVAFKRTGGGWYDTRLFTQLVPMLEETGFNMIDIYPFLKANPAPNGSVGVNSRHDTPAWEPVFVMSKAAVTADYQFEPVRKPYKPKSFTADGNLWTNRLANGDTAVPHPGGARQPNYLLVSTSGTSRTGMPRAEGQSFPVAVPERFILQHTQPGDTVLDPFAGVGTTCRVAQTNGRKYIGVELLEREAAKAREWLDEPFQQSILDFARY